jgi:hypothetical protein
VGLAESQDTLPVDEQPSAPAAESESEPAGAGGIGASTLFEESDSGLTAPPLSTEAPTPPATTLQGNTQSDQDPLDAGQATQLGSSEVTTEGTAQDNPPAASTPAELLKSLSEAPAGNALTGTSLPLSSALTGATTRREQTQRVEAYWDLFQMVIDHYLAHKERTELVGLREGISNPGPEWDAARERAESRVECSLAAVRVAQQGLVEYLSSGSQDYSVLPSDTPYCGAYKTRYAEIFRDRSSPLAASLDELLLRTHQSLTTQAQAVDRSREWMFAVSERRMPQSEGNDLLMAYELFAARRRAFLETVRDYNQQIVRYTEVAAPGPVEPQRLLSMLILSEHEARGTFDGNVQPTSNDGQTNPPAKSTPGWLNSWDSLPNSTERSILVPRR